MIRSTSLFLGGLALSLIAGNLTPSAWAISESAWDGVNAPNRLQPNFSPDFDETGLRVPFTAHVPTTAMPYGDTYWPSNRGGVAYRWHSSPWISPYLVEMAMKFPTGMPAPSAQAKMDKAALAVLAQLEALTPADRAALLQNARGVFHYHQPSRAEAMRMSRSELEQLSPTEKYDLFRGKYDYPMTRSVLDSKAVNAGRAYWEGICHGWAPASVNHAEPLPVDVANIDGVVIPFGSADVKALLDYMYTNPERGFFGLHLGGGSVTQMGRRCNTDLTMNPNAGGPECRGVNAGAFHIAMTNYIGIRHVPFVANVAHGKEIWNNPVYAYSFEIDGRAGPVAGSAPGTVKRVHVKTKIRYPSDDERLAPQWLNTIGQCADCGEFKTNEKLVPDTEGPLDPAPFATAYRYEEGKYNYWLELDSADRIIGGSWTSFDRSDYVWMMAKKPFAGEFEDLSRVYRPAF